MPRQYSLENTRNIGIMEHTTSGNNPFSVFVFRLAYAQCQVLVQLFHQAVVNVT